MAENAYQPIFKLTPLFFTSGIKILHRVVDGAQKTFEFFELVILASLILAFALVANSVQKSEILNV